MNGPIQSGTDALFVRWKTARPTYKMFCEDGVLCENTWNAQSTKIAFILKESNDNFKDIRGKSHNPAGGNSHRFWQNINMWSYVIKEMRTKPEAVNISEARDQKTKSVNHIAYINVKKECHNQPRSLNGDIQDYVDRDWTFIQEQIALIDPDVLLCGGTFRYISKHLRAEPIGTGTRGKRVYQWGEKVVIDFYHPSWWRRTEDAFFDQLKAMLGEVTAAPVGLK